MQLPTECIMQRNAITRKMQKNANATKCKHAQNAKNANATKCKHAQNANTRKMQKMQMQS